MRLYLKLAMMIAATLLLQSALRPAVHCAWEVQFAGRCWVALQLKDAELHAQLVEEGRQRLVQDPERAWDAGRPVMMVNAAAAGPPTTQPILLPLVINAQVIAIVSQRD